MTTPEERTRAVMRTRALLTDLSRGTAQRETDALRELAMTLLRHYPLDIDLDLSGSALPGVWALPSGMVKRDDAMVPRGEYYANPTALETGRRELDALSPVLYVDFDNVTHRCDAYKTEQGIVPSAPAGRFFEFAPVLEKLVRPYPTLQIVLSTSWVEVLGFDEARAQLPIASLRARVVDCTYHPNSEFVASWSTMPRGQQVLRHVRRHGIQRWLAIDDMRAGFEGNEAHLIHCQQGVGLGDKDVQGLFAKKLTTMFRPPESPPLDGESSDEHSP